MTDFAHASGRIRLKDIADRCGVSVSTVSRALAGRPGVREDLRRQMIEEARRAGYPVPEDIAGRRVLVAASGAAMTDYGRNQFTWLVLDGMRAEATRLGLELLPLSLADTGVAGLDDAQSAHRPHGLLLLTVDEPEILDRADRSGIPAVIVNGDDPWMRIDSLTPCNRSSARLATGHLLDHGHRNILFLMHPGRTTILRRLEGWRDALAARGLPAGDDRVLTVEDWLPDLAERAIERYLAEGRPPFTALLCAADILAAGALKALQARGLRVPQDVSVMGMDDLPISEFWQPPLTTMHIPSREMGALAISMLVDRMREARPLARRIELACKLVVRHSVAAAPEAPVGP